MKNLMNDLHWGVVTTDEFGYLHAAFTTKYDAERWCGARNPGTYQVVQL